MRSLLIFLLAALVPIFSFGAPPAFPITVDTRDSTSPTLTTFQGNERTFRVTYTDNDVALDVTSHTPYMTYSDSVHASSYVTSAYSVVTATSGVVDFTFDSTQLNTNGSSFVYEVTLDDASSKRVTFSQGRLRIKKSPFAGGGSAVTYTSVADFDLITESGLISGVTITNSTYYGDGGGLTNVTGGTPATADISDVSVTQTELAELETIGATTISANQWTLLGGVAETLGFAELDLLDGITVLSGSNTGDDATDYISEIELSDEAELEAQITDMGNILQETEIDASSELLAIMDDETGTGLLVFGTAPTFTTSITMGSAALSEAELEILDGATITTAELEELSDGSTTTLHDHTGGSSTNLSDTANIAYLNTDNDFVGQQTITDTSFPVMQTVRTAASDGTLWSTHAVKAMLSTNMTDGFGTGLMFQLEDDTSGEINIGRIGAVRDGADAQGKLVFSVNSGLTTALDIDTTGNADFNGNNITGVSTGTITNLVVTGNIELSDPTANTLTATAGVLSIEGNVVHHTGGTDITDADISDTLTSSILIAAGSPSTVGIVRMANADFLGWRNAADTGNAGVSLDAADEFAFVGAGLSVGAASLGPGLLKFKEDTDFGANFASFTLPAGDLVANTEYFWPPDDGDAGEVLQTDGSGVLTWEVDAGAAGGDSVTVTNSATVDPSFNNTGDIAFTLTGTTGITANIQSGVIVNADMANDALDADKIVGDSVDDDDLDLAAGGTGQSLTDPGADGIMLWDDSDSGTEFDFAAIGSGLSYDGTTLTATGAGDSVSVDGVGVVDPDFVSTGDIDFIDTSNTITANILSAADYTSDNVTISNLTIVTTLNATSSTVSVSTILANLIDTSGAADMDYGSDDVTDHTFTTDSTGTGEIVLPAGAIDTTEILDGTLDILDMDAGLTTTLGLADTSLQSLATDSVTPDILDDDANTPVAGYAVIVEAGAVSFDYSDLSAVYQPIEATLTDIADGTIAEDLVNTANPWAVNEGGSGAATFTDGFVLLGSGTSAFTGLDVTADGAMLVGDGTNDPVAESGATLRTSIGVGTGDSPQFTGIELGAAIDTTLARTGAGLVTIEGDQIIDAGTTIFEYLYVNAGAMIPEATGGAEATAATEHATNDIMTDSLAFDMTEEKRCGFWVTFPEGWDEGTVQMKFHWYPDSVATTGTVKWDVAAQSYADSDVIDQALGTEQTVTDTFITSGDLHISAKLGTALTIADATAGEPVYFMIARDVDDTMDEDAHLLGVVIEYSRTNQIATAW